MPTYGLYLSTLVHEFIGIYVRKLSYLIDSTKDGLEQISNNLLSQLVDKWLEIKENNDFTV